MNLGRYERALEGLRRLGGPDCREANLLEQARAELANSARLLPGETAAYYIRECLDGVTKLFGIEPRQHDVRSPAKQLLASLESVDGRGLDDDEVQRSIRELRLAIEMSESERGRRVARAIASQIGQEPRGGEIERFATRWARTVERAAQILHGDAHDEEEVSRLVSEAVDLVSALAGRMSGNLDELDALAAIAEPSDSDADRVVALTADPRRAGYFYRGLGSPAWIPPLQDRGVFEPPLHGWWPQGDYLARAASGASEVALGLVTQILRDPHPLAIPVALSVCAAIGAPAIDTAVAALQSPSYPAPHAVAYRLREISASAADARLLGFIPRLADASLELLSGSGSVVVSKFEEYDYSSLVSTFVARCPDADVMELARVLRFKLDRALDLGRERVYRSVSLLRSTIAESEGGARREVPDALVSGIRDTLDRLQALGTPLAGRLALLEGDEEIVRRLRAYHLLQDLDEAWDAASEMVVEEIASARPTPETELLLRVVWERSAPDRRQELLERLGEPRTGVEDPVAEQVRVWAWLEAADEVPEPWFSMRRELEAEFGEGGHDSRFGSGAAYMPSRTPRDVSDLVALGPVESLRFAQEWRSERDSWLEPSAEGLANALTTASAADPGPWVEALVESVGALRPRYVAAVLDGVAQAIRDGPANEVPWDTIVSVGEAVGRHLDVTQSNDEEATWEWAATSVVSLLVLGCDKDLVPAPLLVKTADCLRWYTRYRSPATVGASDTLTMAINKLSTRALEALLGVSLTAQRLGADVRRRVAELFEAIDEELSDASERRFAVAICGRWLHVLLSLDHAAAEARLPTLFGDLTKDEVDLVGLRDSLPWVRKTRDTLVALEPHARAYLDAIDEDEGDRHDIRAAVDWMVLCYEAELPTAWIPDEVLATLRLPARLSRAAEMYGRIIRDVHPLGEERADRALAYWDAALVRDDHATAYEGFGWWSESDLSDYDWLSRLGATIDRTHGQLDWDQEAVARLCRLPELDESWRVLAVMVRGVKDYWTLAGWRDSFRELLEATEPSWEVNEVGRRELIEALLEREMFEFREFLH